MKIAVLGAGAMGCFYGGMIFTKHPDVLLLDVWQDHVEAIKRQGLRIKLPGEEKVLKIKAEYPHLATEKVKFLFVFTKAFQTERALQSVSQIIDPETVAVTLQNGLGNIEKIEQSIPKDRIIVGITRFPSDMMGPGKIRSMGPGYTKIMTATGRITEDLRWIQSLMHNAGLNCSLSEDVFQEIWEKVAFNSSLSTVTAVTKLTVGAIGHFPEGRELSFKIAEEVLQVAEAEGIKVSKESVFGAIESVFARNSSHLSSMLQDVMACRPTEIESITGAVIQKAERHGIKVETVRALYQLVRVIEQSYIV